MFSSLLDSLNVAGWFAGQNVDSIERRMQQDPLLTTGQPNDQTKATWEELAMKATSYKGTLRGGHKDYAVEFPHTPEELWGIPPRALWPGRRGHHVRVKLNNTTGDTCIVPRLKKFWVIVDGELKKRSRGFRRRHRQRRHRTAGDS